MLAKITRGRIHGVLLIDEDDDTVPCLILTIKLEGDEVPILWVLEASACLNLVLAWGQAVDSEGVPSVPGASLVIINL